MCLVKPNPDAFVNEEAQRLAAANGRHLTLLRILDKLTNTKLHGLVGPIGLETFGVSNLLTWSACLRAGATVLSGLSRNANLWSIGTLPVPQWLPEIGMVTPSDPIFSGYPVSPKRVTGMLVVSQQLLKSVRN